MADLKISQLTASTTPLAGTEVLPVVQSSTTKQVSVANLTAGRAVSVASVAITGGSSAPGVISKDATTGLQIRGLAGSGYDLELTNSGGLTSMTVATGTYKTKFWDDVSTLGNVVISTSGKGIDFSATPGTGTSELLADYEEGDWTPTLSSATGAITTVGAATGFYTKVGRLVTLNANVVITTNGTGATALLFGNLPYSISTTNTTASGIESAVSGKSLAISAYNSTTLYVTFYDFTYPGANNARIVVSVTYPT